MNEEYEDIYSLNYDEVVEAIADLENKISRMYREQLGTRGLIFSYERDLRELRRHKASLEMNEDDY